MSIYIKGMEMPGTGRYLIVYPDGRVVDTDIDGESQCIIPGSKAIPVPNHGDLIDRDALGTPGTIEEDTLWRGRIETKVYLASTIYNAATIIPADKEADG